MVVMFDQAILLAVLESFSIFTKLSSIMYRKVLLVPYNQAQAREGVLEAIIFPAYMTTRS